MCTNSSFSLLLILLDVCHLVGFEAAGLHLLLGEESVPRLLHAEACHGVSEPLTDSRALAVFIQTEKRGSVNRAKHIQSEVSPTQINVAKNKTDDKPGAPKPKNPKT